MLSLEVDQHRGGDRHVAAGEGDDLLRRVPWSRMLKSSCWRSSTRLPFWVTVT